MTVTAKIVIAINIVVPLRRKRLVPVTVRTLVQIVHMVVPSTFKERITLDMHSRCSINPRNGKNFTRIEPVLNELITVS